MIQAANWTPQSHSWSTKSKVLVALSKMGGYNTFSPRQGARRFSVPEARISAAVYTLRKDGYPIHTNKQKRSDGSSVNVYSLAGRRERLVVVAKCSDRSPRRRSSLGRPKTV